MHAIDIYFGFEAPSPDAVRAIAGSVPEVFVFCGGTGVFDEAPEPSAEDLVVLVRDGVSVESTAYWARTPTVGGRICGVSVTIYRGGGVLFGVGTDAQNESAVLDAFRGLGARAVLVVDERPPPETFEQFRVLASQSP